MPTYTYKCEKCRKIYEIIQRMADAHITECPVCKSGNFRRIFTPPTVKTQRKSSKRKSLGSVGDFGPEL
jgi:putative FmdB family regulatory protein